MTPDSRGHWDDRYRSSAGSLDPALFLEETAHLLPDGGSMVDVAGGSGRNALWFARRGFATTVVDISGEGLSHVRQAAEAEGLDIERLNRDVEADGLPPDRAWDVLLVHLFWHPGVLMASPGALKPGGLLLFAQPTVLNLERHDRPGRRFLLEQGELGRLTQEMTDIEILELSEAWRNSGRHEARLVARKREVVTEGESER